MGRITSDGKHVFVAGKPIEMIKLAQEIGGKWTGQEWRFPLFKAPEVNERFDDSYRRTEDFVALLEGHSVIRAAYQYKEAETLAPIPLTAGEPWNHQLRAYHFAQALPHGVMLYMGMATGKSRVAVDIIQNKGARLALVTAPVAVLDDETWIKQFRKYCVVPYDLIQLFDQPIPKRIALGKQFLAMHASSDKLIVIVTNHASFTNEAFVKWASGVPWDVFVIDESSKFKRATGVQSKGATKVAKASRFRVALTGTPNPHSIEDSFAQFRMLDSSVFGVNLTEYRARYIRYENVELDTGRVIPRQIGTMNDDEWRANFYSLAFHVGREVLDLPPIQHITRSFSLEPSAWKHYRALRDEFTTALALVPDCDQCGNERFNDSPCYQCNGVGWLGLDSDTRTRCSNCNGTGVLHDDCSSCIKRISVTNVLAKAMKLHQLTGGYMDGEKLSEAKLKALIDVLDGLDASEPVVVMCRFTKDIENVRAAGAYLDREVLELSGKVKQTKEWQDGGAPILAVQISSGAMGIDLTRAAYCIYYSVGTSLGDYLQSEARVHRPGQERPVTYYHLVAKGTIDASIRRALSQRQAVLATLMHDAREGQSANDDGDD